jgi:hypothetical protein
VIAWAALLKEVICLGYLTSGCRFNALHNIFMERLKLGQADFFFPEVFFGLAQLFREKTG